MRSRFSLIVMAAVLLSACAEKGAEVEPYDPARDYFSFANTDEFLTEHLALDIDVDFEAEELRGSVVLRLRRIDSTSMQVILDTRDLAVSDVQVLLAGGDPVAAEYHLGEGETVKGTPLIVSLPKAVEA
ncbi:MAG: hypothetical protein WBM34_14535, partial [Woeseiaceae bacterium]